MLKEEARAYVGRIWIKLKRYDQELRAHEALFYDVAERDFRLPRGLYRSTKERKAPQDH